MDTYTFQRFREIIYRESGIVLPPEKMALLESRIQKRLNFLKVATEGEYLEIVELNREGELEQLIDAISTNVTHFYREPNHFSIYRQALLEKGNKTQRQLKIWCAAASSGEEPYTLTFEALEAFQGKSDKFRILATDICTKVLKTALLGLYNPEAITQIPQSIRDKYFHKVLENGEPRVQVSSEVMTCILFKRLNLVSFPYPVHGPFDIVFCRNVMIYFDHKTRERIVNELWRLMAPGGLLFVSHSENLLGLTHRFSKLHSSVYQKDSRDG